MRKLILITSFFFFALGCGDPMGVGEYCLEEQDCPKRLTCIAERCHVRCFAEGDCSSGHHCEEGACLERCSRDLDCSRTGYVCLPRPTGRPGGVCWPVR